MCQMCPYDFRCGHRQALFQWCGQTHRTHHGRYTAPTYHLRPRTAPTEPINHRDCGPCTNTTLRAARDTDNYFGIGLTYNSNDLYRFLRAQPDGTYT